MAAPSRRARPSSRPAATPSARVVQVGLTQMACGPDPKANLARQLALARTRGRRKARRSSARRSCSVAVLLPDRGPRASSGWPRRFPGRPPTPSSSSRRSTAWSSSPRSSRSAPPGCTTTPRRSSTPTGRCWASTARCTSPTTRCSTRSSTSRPATPASAPGRRSSAPSACSSAGISGTRKRRGSPRCRAPRSSSTRPPSAGTRGEGASTARPSTSRGRLIQRSHAVANGCYVCVANRIGHELVHGPDGKPVSADGLEFWGQSFVAVARRPDRHARQHRPRRGAGRARATSTGSSSRARTGRSCAIAASTPTAA